MFFPFKFSGALLLEWGHTAIKIIFLVGGIVFLGYSWYENEKWEKTNQTLELDMFMEDLSLLRDIKSNNKNSKNNNSKLSIQAKYWQRLNDRQQFFQKVQVQQIKTGTQWKISAGEMICYDADKCWLRDKVVLTKNQQTIKTEQMNADFGLSIFTTHSPAVLTTPTQTLNVQGFSISELQDKQYLIDLKGRLKLKILPN